MLVALEIFTLMSETEVEVKNCGWGLGGLCWIETLSEKTKMDQNSVFTLFNPDGPG